MQIFIVVSAIILGVIGALVYLRIHDRKAGRTRLDRYTPLQEPDLDFTSLPDDAEKLPVKPSRPVFAGDPHPAKIDAASTVAEPDTSVTKTDSETNWSEALQLLRQYRNKNELESALELCFQFLPKDQAFEQLMLTQRAIIRHHMNIHQDASDDLDMLYNMAVLSTLYADTTGLPEPVQSTMFSREALNRMGAEYSYVGYEELKHLKKADITLLVRRWGEPVAHQHPGKVYEKEWWKLV